MRFNLRAFMGGEAQPWQNALVAIQAIIGYEWLMSGWGKLMHPEFADGMSKTLAAFAAENPFPWYKGFLTGFAAEHAASFGRLVAWSELAAGIALAACAIASLSIKDGRGRGAVRIMSVAALVGGMLMNANFYLAAGWTSPSTKGINVIMFWAQAALAYGWLAARLRR